MGLGPHAVFAGLNSFYDGHVDREETLVLLRKRLAEIEDDSLILMVTHQVVITAVTGIFPPSGGWLPSTVVLARPRLWAHLFVPDFLAHP